MFSSVPIRNSWNRCEVMQDHEGHLVQSKGLADEGSSGQVEGRRRARARQNPQITRGRSPLCSSLFCSIGCNFTLGVFHIFTALYPYWRKKKVNIFQKSTTFVPSQMYNAIIDLFLHQPELPASLCCWLAQATKDPNDKLPHVTHLNWSLRENRNTEIQKKNNRTSAGGLLLCWLAHAQHHNHWLRNTEEREIKQIEMVKNADSDVW